MRHAKDDSAVRAGFDAACRVCNVRTTGVSPPTEYLVIDLMHRTRKFILRLEFYFQTG